MVRSHGLGSSELHQRISRLLITALLVGTVAIELAVPVVAWRWRQKPFLGLFFEQTLVVSGIRNEAWGVDIPGGAAVRLVAVGEQTVASNRDLRQVWQGLSFGEEVALTLQPQDGSAALTARTVTQWFPTADWITLFWLPYAVGLAYLGIGIWVFRQQGDQRPAQSFALCCALVSLSTGMIFDVNTSHVFSRIWTAALPFTAAAFLHLGLVFPEEGPLIRRWPVLRSFPYLLALALAIVSELRLYDTGDPWAYIPTWRWSYVFLGLAAFVFFALMLYTQNRTLSGIVRQQVRIVLVGSLLSFLPMAVYMVLAGLAFNVPFLTTLYLPPLVIFPLFIAYAILRYKLLGMDLVISRGLAYTILVAGVAGAYFLALTVLGQTLGIHIASGNSLILALMAVILVIVLNPLRENIERLVDRLLGRQRVDYRQSLQIFSRELVTTPLDLSTILERLLAQIEPISHSAPMLVFLRDPWTQHYVLRQAINFLEPEDLDASFSRNSDLARWLIGLDHPVYLLGEESRSAAHRLSAEEWANIEALGLVLFLPLRGQVQLAGWVALGPRLSGEPYSPDDLAFLSTLVDQTAIAIENAQLLGDLEQRLLQLDVLRKISEAVDLRRDLEDLLDLIYAQTRRVLEVDNFYVALYDQARQQFHFAYYVEERERRQPEQERWPLGTGLTSQIVRQRQPIVTDDYLAECERLGIPSSGKPGKAWMGVPLIARGQVLGVLNASSFKPDYRYAPEHVQLMSAIADQAAVAIDRMRLYQETEARAAELVTLNEVSGTISSSLDLPIVLDLIMGKVVEILHVEAGSLLLLDKQSGDLIFQVALGAPGSQDLIGRHNPVDRGIIGHVVQSGQAEIINDAQADPRWNREVDRDIGFVTRRILCVPMLSRDKVIGVIEVINHRDGSPFEDEEAQLLTNFAAQAAIAIENARLYTQTDQALARRVEELSTMQRIDRELSETLDFDRVMDMTLEWALRGTGAPVGVITLYDERRQGFLLLTMRGYPPEYERYRAEPWPLDRGILTRVIRTGEPALVDDVTQDPDYHAAQPTTRSQLTVPIRREQRVIGVVNVESPEIGAFDQDDLAFIQRLADHAAIAIENAHLYRETQRRAEDMAQLYDISLTVSSHLTLEEVLEAVYERIRDVWDPPVFFIALYDKPDDALDFSIYVDRGTRLEPFRQVLAEQSGFSAWIVRNRQPILIHDWQEEAERSPVQGLLIGDMTRSWLGVPLVVGDQMVGVMAVQDYAPNAYGEDHRRFLSTVASEVAIAIENARLHAETEKRLREQTALREAGSVISSALDLEVVLSRIAEQMGRAVDATSAYICTHDAETMTSTVLAEYIGPEASAEEQVSDLGKTYAEIESEFLENLRAGQHDTSHIDDPDLAEFEREHMLEYGAQTILYIPLRVRGRLIGYTELWESRHPREFTPEEIALCQGIAQQAAIAIENARLYEGVKEANEAKSEFIDFVAHELKQPMTAMQGYARMLTIGIGGQLTDLQEEFVRVINANVDRMGKLVNDLLEISRLEAGRIKLKLASVRLQEVVDEAVTNTRTEIEARNHRLEVEVPVDLPPVLGDRERLVQILTNLVSNAYKYTPDGGTIRITVNGHEDAEIPPDHLLVSVSDTGIGMSPQDLVGLQEKFFRADHQLVQTQPGTGLGVSITRNLVALHGGEFMIESELGQGSTFRFTVPIAA